MEHKELVRIATVNDKIQAEMLVNLLKEQGIHAYSQPISCVDYMDSYLGYGTAGEDIIVNAYDKEDAKTIVNEYLYPEGEYTQVHSRTIFVRIMAILILVVVATAALLNLIPEVIEFVR